MMNKPIQALSAGVPATPTELSTLGRTLKRRATDVLAHFTRPGTSNGPTEAINGRLEHLPGNVLGFRNPTTTSPDPCRRPVASDPDNTLDWEEPQIRASLLVLAGVNDCDVGTHGGPLRAARL